MDRRHVLSICLGLALGATHPAQTQEVQRVEVREGGLVGRFFAAVGASRRTGVLMLGGSQAFSMTLFTTLPPKRPQAGLNRPSGPGASTTVLSA